MVRAILLQRVKFPLNSVQLFCDSRKCCTQLTVTEVQSFDVCKKRIKVGFMIDPLQGDLVIQLALFR